jgi:hypothetical protein
MKTGVVAILILLLTAGALAVPSKACKTGHHPWCVIHLLAEWKSAYQGRTGTSACAAKHPGRLSGCFGRGQRSEALALHSYLPFQRGVVASAAN